MNNEWPLDNPIEHPDQDLLSKSRFAHGFYFKRQDQVLGFRERAHEGHRVSLDLPRRSSRYGRLSCYRCGGELQLSWDDGLDYSWSCPDGCGPRLGTGVLAMETNPRFLEAGGRGHRRHFRATDTSLYVRPERITPEVLLSAWVCMPYLLHHLIECTMRVCYMGIYRNL